MENGKKEEPGLQERVHDRTDIADVIRVTKRYYQIIKTQKKNSCKLCWDKGPVIKNIQRQRNFFQTLNQSKSTINFKANLHEFFKKYPVLKKSSLFSNYFENNFKSIKMFSIKPV